MALRYTTDKRPEPQPIKAILVGRGIHQYQFATMIGKSAQWVNAVVNGWVNPSETVRQASSDELGMPVEALYRPKEKDDS